MADGVLFEDGKTVEMFLEPLRRGLNDKNTAMAYQVRGYLSSVDSGPLQGTASGCRRSSTLPSSVLHQPTPKLPYSRPLHTCAFKRSKHDSVSYAISGAAGSRLSKRTGS